jgi:hypothetical protein
MRRQPLADGEDDHIRNHVLGVRDRIDLSHGGRRASSAAHAGDALAAPTAVREGGVIPRPGPRLPRPRRHISRLSRDMPAIGAEAQHGLGRIRRTFLRRARQMLPGRTSRSGRVAKQFGRWAPTSVHRAGGGRRIPRWAPTATGGVNPSAAMLPHQPPGC